MELFKLFDATISRAPIFFAGLVLLLVVTLIIADVLAIALSEQPTEIPTSSGTGQRIECVILRTGPPVCDVPPPIDP